MQHDYNTVYVIRVSYKHSVIISATDLLDINISISATKYNLASNQNHVAKNVWIKRKEVCGFCNSEQHHINIVYVH